MVNRSLRALLIFSAFTLSACVGPVRSFETFEGKAAGTADTILSSVQTAKLAADLTASGKASGPYVSVVVADAEQGAESARAAFDSIQPPDQTSDELRGRADALFARAISTISMMRIAARREDVATIQRLGRALQQFTAPLERLAGSGG